MPGMQLGLSVRVMNSVGWMIGESWFSSWQGPKIFVFLKVSRVTLGPT
jgi:hypothetical protein